MTESLDATDWSILAGVQRDGDPAHQAGTAGEPQRLPANRAVRRLEETGVITGYHARIDPAKVGFTVLAVARLKYPGSQHQHCTGWSASASRSWNACEPQATTATC